MKAESGIVLGALGTPPAMEQGERPSHSREREQCATLVERDWFRTTPLTGASTGDADVPGECPDEAVVESVARHEKPKPPRPPPLLDRVS